MDMPLPPMNPEVAHLRRKSAQRKYVRRLRYVRILWAIAGVLLVLLMAEVLVALCFSPRFWIYRIEVTGGDTLTMPEIIRLINLPEGTNFYRVSLGRLAERLRAGEPRVLAATVRRGAVGCLAVQVQERRPLCRIGDTQPALYLDNQRVLFSRPTAPTPPVPVVDGVAFPTPATAFGKRVDALHVRDVINSLQAMHEVFPKEQGLDVARVIVAPTGRISLVLRQGTQIWLGQPRELTAKMWVVNNTIIAASAQGNTLEQLEYIDARNITRDRVGYAAYYRLRGGWEASTP